MSFLYYFRLLERDGLSVAAFLRVYVDFLRNVGCMVADSLPEILARFATNPILHWRCDHGGNDRKSRFLFGILQHEFDGSVGGGPFGGMQRYLLGVVGAFV